MKIIDQEAKTDLTSNVLNEIDVSNIARE